MNYPTNKCFHLTSAPLVCVRCGCIFVICVILSSKNKILHLHKSNQHHKTNATSSLEKITLCLLEITKYVIEQCQQKSDEHVHTYIKWRMRNQEHIIFKEVPTLKQLFATYFNTDFRCFDKNRNQNIFKLLLKRYFNLTHHLCIQSSLNIVINIST